MRQRSLDAVPAGRHHRAANSKRMRPACGDPERAPGPLLTAQAPLAHLCGSVQMKAASTSLTFCRPFTRLMQ